MTSHRRAVRPRYGRIATLAASVMVTVVAALAGLGVLSPTQARDGLAAGRTAADTGAATTPTTPGTTTPTTSPTSPTTPTTGTAPAGGATSVTAAEGPSGTPAGAGDTTTATATAVPARSGTGRRIVFSQGLQRVWLVAAHGGVRRTYPVSGSLTDNLQPGTYAVTGHQRHATGIDDSGTMQYFVVFTAGPTGAAIGFHTIPVKDGRPLQTKAQLGTPTSHGCIRQTTPDAIALWHFAPVGTKVVVVA